MYKKGECLVHILELLQKSDLQHSSTKPDNEGHPTIETAQVLVLRVVSNVVLYFFLNYSWV